ncbi:MAG: Fe-S cluster assembly protein SufD [Petrotoga sp.]|nr:Fe-S cluster assembly protein SufD [Petrotoga sp.]
MDENEVNAAHAATVGSIEKEKLYYLMTRGFSLEEAKKLISSGLFESAIDRIKVFDEGMSQVVKDVIFQRI